MGLYTGNSNWVNDVYEYDVTDPVIGGPTGTANKPMHDLADRTTWLKDQIGRMDRLEGEIIITGNAPIPGTLAGYLIVAYASAIIDLTLDDAATFPHGAIIPISSYCTPGSVVNIKTSAGQTFYNPVDGVKSVLHMHHNEQLCLVALTNHFKVQYAHGNFYCAGEEVKGRKERGNTISLKGQLISRTAYPRLWAYVQSLTMWQEIVDETLWFTDDTTYRGLFSTGDALTTFRLPDERGMFERMLDGGRGIDFGRGHNFAGGYEADENKAHRHFQFVDNGNTYANQNLTPNNKPERRAGNGAGVGNNNYEYNITGSNGEATLGLTSSVGGNENLVKNIGKLNLIKF